jgi:hypothetical protein
MPASASAFLRRHIKSNNQFPILYLINLYVIQIEIECSFIGMSFVLAYTLARVRLQVGQHMNFLAETLPLNIILYIYIQVKINISVYT